MPRRADFRRISSKKKRLTKTKAEILQAEELKEILTQAIVFGDQNDALEEVSDDTLPYTVTASHWHLREDAWHIPAPNGGGRDLVFLAFMGRVHKASVMQKTCHDRDCVNPFHVTIMDKKEAKQRAEGTWDKRMVAPEGRVVTQKDYEALLCDSTTRDKKRKSELEKAKALESQALG